MTLDNLYDVRHGGRALADKVILESVNVIELVPAAQQAQQQDR